MSARPAARLSVIIRCFNEERHIGRLLSGIAAQSVEDVEIVVVDSGSTDRTLEVASAYPVKLLHIAPEAFSFGRALNMGCEAATGEVLAIASAHVYPLYEDWLARLAGAFADPKVGLVYGSQRGDQRTRYSERQIFAKTYPEGSVPDQGHPFCNNANAAVRRSLWERLRYDEALTGLEDVDFAHRAMRLGHRIAYDAEAAVVHVHEETPGRIYKRYFREALALKRILPEERFTALDLIRLWPANIVSDLYHALGDRVLLRRAAEIVMFRTMQFWGTYHGWRRRAAVGRELRQTFYYPKGFTRSGAGEDASGERREIDYTEARG